MPPERLTEWLATARAAWPELAVPTESFVAHLERHHVVDLTEPNITDLYLACACADGNPKAIAELETRCITDVGKAIWQVGVGDRDDVLQRVRELLLVRGDHEPLIASYAGRGSLRGWVRSIVLRTAIKYSRATNRAVPIDEHEFLELAASTDEPELEPYKQRYRDEFRAAFRTVVDSLSVRHRNLLRQYFLDRMTVDELGVLYRVHRATAARWIHDVRAAVVDGVRRELAARLSVDDVGLRSMIDLVASQLELSLERLVGDIE